MKTKQVGCSTYTCFHLCHAFTRRYHLYLFKQTHLPYSNYFSSKRGCLSYCCLMLFKNSYVKAVAPFIQTALDNGLAHPSHNIQVFQIGQVCTIQVHLIVNHAIILLKLNIHLLTTTFKLQIHVLQIQQLQNPYI